MSGNRNLAVRLPAATMSGVLSTIAAGLRGDTSDVLDLRVDQVCLRSLSMLRSSNPLLERSLTICLPMALLGIGIYRYVLVFKNLTCGAQQVYSSCLCHLTVPGTHELNKDVCNFLAMQGVGQDSRSTALASVDTHFMEMDEDEDEAQAAIDPGLKYLPAPTTDAWFTFKGRWIKFTRAVKEQPRKTQYGVVPAPDGDVTLSCFSLTGNVKPIKDFLDYLQAGADAKKHAKIVIKRSTTDARGNPGGTSSVLRPARQLDSVSMNSQTRNDMIKDMTDYLSSQKWYGDRGIPWRRGYLLYGPPGTGKTSIATAIAGHFHIPLVIVVLSTPGFSDAALQSAFDFLPRRCVVLLEDLDSAGIGRDRMTSASQDSGGDDSDVGNGPPRGTRMGSKPKSSGITLSGLLNAIDGPASHEGRILVCTTNSPDSLDPALLRPGRIDKKILFGNATTEVTESLFAHIFADATGARSKSDVAQMAKSFAALVPEDQLTPAEIQNFLLQHRDDPSKVLNGAEVWVRELLAVKNGRGNVAAFNGQI